MIKGKCLCGEISYQISGDLLFLYNCHCVECRAFSGASHATNASISADEFQVTDLSGHLTQFKTRNGTRYFCSNCGSSIYSYPVGGEKYPALHVGTISGPPVKDLDANIWVSEKCRWVELSSSVKNHEKALA